MLRDKKMENGQLMNLDQSVWNMGHELKVKKLCVKCTCIQTIYNNGNLML